MNKIYFVQWANVKELYAVNVLVQGENLTEKKAKSIATEYVKKNYGSKLSKRAFACKCYITNITDSQVLSVEIVGEGW
jgi:NADPH-dependent 7-cyano-7-deazaguanine reductase QueF